MAHDTTLTTTIMEAISDNNLSKLKDLQKEGHNITTIEDSSHQTALHICAQQDNPLLIEWLISQGASINHTDINGFTPLHIAALSNTPKITDVLIQSGGADINAENKRGFTPLMIACWLNHYDIVRKLLAAKAEVEIFSLDGFGAIHYAVWQASIETIQIFMDLDLSLDLKTRSGINTITLAQMADKPDFAQLLADHLNVNISNQESEHLSASKLVLEMAEDGLPEIKLIKDSHDDSAVSSYDPIEIQNTRQSSNVALNTIDNFNEEDEEFDIDLPEDEEEKTTETKVEEVEAETTDNQPDHSDTDQESFIDHSSTAPINISKESKQTHHHAAQDIQSSDTNEEIQRSISEINHDNGIQLNSIDIDNIPAYQAEDDNTHRTLLGNYVSSALQLSIYNLLALMNIPFHYQRIMYGTVTPGECHPTFSFFDYNGDVIIWLILDYEPFHPDNINQWQQESLWYQKNGFNYDINFFMSHVSNTKGIDSLDLYRIASQIKSKVL